MGIRLALGTTARRLRRTMVRQTMVAVGVGALPGVGIAIVAGRHLSSLVQGADTALVSTPLFAVVAIATIATAAIWSASRHIARLDIADVLRAESAN
jgi:ABC-type antimicrobial peptide transport system permease subunit